MKVICIGNRGMDLPEAVISISGNYDIEFDLEIGYSYNVYGISVWRNTFAYLIVTSGRIDPSWYPAELFSVVDPLLPGGCCFKFFQGNKDPSIEYLQALWGYRELIEQEDHYRALTEMEPDALKIFDLRKHEIDTQYC